MDAHKSVKQDRILILDEDAKEQSLTMAALSKLAGAPEVSSAQDVTNFRELIKKDSYDVVILDLALSNASAVELIHELRLKDWDPAVLVVSKPVDSKHITEAYNAGCQRCLIKQDDWTEKLAPAVRQALRLKRLEQENLRLVSKLTEANALLAEKNRRLDEFSGTVAHDIRGPLGGISMKLEYIKDIYGEDFDDRFKQVVDGTLSSTRRLIGIVQAMYEYAKLSSRLGETEEIDLAPFIEEVIHDLSFPESLDIQIGIGELPIVYGCKGLLRKVFQNLIGNAVKYSDKKTIIINISSPRVINKSMCDFAEIQVSDNGPGISKEDQKEIFNMFSRGSNVKSIEGIGIGLAVVKRIVELHLGTIEVHTNPSNGNTPGTSFTFSLPLEQIELSV